MSPYCKWRPHTNKKELRAPYAVCRGDAARVQDALDNAAGMLSQAVARRFLTRIRPHMSFIPDDGQ
eukprot:5325286-Amphidinium_carterae.1